MDNLGRSVSKFLTAWDTFELYLKLVTLFASKMIHLAYRYINAMNLFK